LSFDYSFANALWIKEIQMLDQDGNNVPNDLVLMPNPCDLDDENIDLVYRANWYEHKGILLVSVKEINYLSEATIEDADETLEGVTEIMKVDDCLKRCEEDAFYHA
jgi:hypothetical protein